jgi:hypothetical protein
MRNAGRRVSTDPEYDELDDALRRCGSSYDAAQSHGLLASRLAVTGADGSYDWLSYVLQGTDVDNALRKECEGLLTALAQVTSKRLSERQSEFEPLLPDDAAGLDERALALGHWCEGYLHGLVSVQHSNALKKKLAEEPIADIIKDFLQITRASVDDSADESTEDSYIELVEYLRVASQLVFEELAGFRQPPPTSAVH